MVPQPLIFVPPGAFKNSAQINLTLYHQQGKSPGFKTQLTQVHPMGGELVVQCVLCWILTPGPQVGPGWAFLESWPTTPSKCQSKKHSNLRGSLWVYLSPTVNNWQEENLSRLRECSGEWQFCALFYTLQSKQDLCGGNMKSSGETLGS